MKVIAYCEWFAFEHRSRSKSKSGSRTPVEKMLAGPLPAGLRAVLEPRSSAVASVYRVAAIVTGESLDLVDLITGAEVTIQDRGLSTSGTEGVVLVLRVYPVGDFRFASIAGPVIPAFLADRALCFLEDEAGLRLDDESNRRRAGHLLGRLWSWTEASREDAGGLKITNTEGHELLWHSASFEVADADRVAQMLDARSEFDGSHGSGEWIWFDEQDAGGGHRHLGSLTLFDSELLLEVNSRERFAAGRRLLESLPGVRFLRATEQALDPRGSDARPLDDRLPDSGAVPEPDAATIHAVQDIIRKQCFRWLDEQVPLLGGLTPRAACATADGRRRVERLIRTYPDPGGIPGVTVPREEMLRELGLA